MNRRFVISKTGFADTLGIGLLLLVSFLDNTVFAFPVRIDLILLALAGGIFLLGKGGLSLQNDKFTILFLLSFLVVVFNNYEIRRGNYTYAFTFALLLILLNTRKKNYDRWASTFYKFLLWFGVFAATITYVCYFVPGIYTSYILPRANDAYYNSLVYCFRMGYQPGIAVHYSSNGMFLAIFSGIAFCEFVSIKKGKTLSRILFVIFAMIALLLTAKRAHVLFAAAGMLVVYYMSNADKKQTRLFKILGIMIVAAVLFVIVGQFIPSISGFIDRFIQSNENGDILNNRDTLYSYAILLFLGNPILGNGWGSYKYLRQGVFGEYNNAHNVFFQLLAETGVIGTAIFICVILTLLITCIKSFQKVNRSKQQYSIQEYKLSAFGVFMQCFFLLYCFTGNPLYDRVIWVPVVLSAVIGNCIGRVDRGI